MPRVDLPKSQVYRIYEVMTGRKVNGKLPRREKKRLKKYMVVAALRAALEMEDTERRGNATNNQPHRTRTTGESKQR